MLYGAYGTTGRLILEEAVRRGHRPLLAGRDHDRLEALGQATGLQTLPLALEDSTALRTAVSRVSAVLLAAGPFEVTGPPMRSACLGAAVSYLDVNGEIDDYQAALACDRAARDAGIGIIPGVGYGVVFVECLAAHVARRLPDATWMRLSLATRTAGRSRGATLSAAAGLAAGGRDIHQGTLRARPMASPTWRAPEGDRRGTTFAAAPLAELVAVQRSTGIPNIVAGIPLSRPVAGLMRVAGPWIGRLLARLASRAATPVNAQPDSSLAGISSRAWAEAGDGGGSRVAAVLETGEGYRAAASAAVRAVELQLQTPRLGALTPVQAFGADFALLVPDTRIDVLP
jgi:short subunit dehydrogenase-like uncharacterized protein